MGRDFFRRVFGRAGVQFRSGRLFFDVQGHDEMDEVHGVGCMQLTSMDRVEIELEYDGQDAPALQAKRFSVGEADVWPE